jgi:hypothetical protein
MDVIQGLRARLHYIRYISITAAAVFFVTTAATTSAAATRTWDGGSLVNDNWQTPENWEGDVMPSAGDDLVFPESHSARERDREDR